MKELFSILRGTPVWVWLVLAELLYVGIKATRSRIVYIPTLFVIPVLLLGLKYKALFSQETGILLGALLLSAVISFIAHRNARIEVIKESWSVRLPGSYSTLIILLSFFAVKYYFGYLGSVAPDIAARYSLVETAISGLFSGFFWGRSISYLARFLREKQR